MRSWKIVGSRMLSASAAIWVTIGENESVYRDVKCVGLGLESVEGGSNILRSPDAM